MTRILIVDGTSSLLTSALVAKLSAELGGIECEVLKEPPPSEFTLKAFPDDWLRSANVASTLYPLDDASNKLVTSSNLGGGAATGYNEFVASRGGKYGASKRRP